MRAKGQEEEEQEQEQRINPQCYFQRLYHFVFMVAVVFSDIILCAWLM